MLALRITVLAVLSATCVFAASSNCRQIAVDFIVLEGDATLKAIEDDIRQDLAKVGINVTTRLLAKDPFNKAMVDGDFNLAFSETWGPPYDPHSYAKSWLSPDEAHWAALDGMPAPLTKEVLGQKIDAALSTADIRERQEAWTEILTGIHEQAIDLPFAGKRIPAVVSKRLAGYMPGHQQFDYPVHNMQVLTGSREVRLAPGGQTGLFAGVGRLDPHTYRPNEFFANNWVYEGLIEYGAGGTLLPSLAVSWSVDDGPDGGQTYTFNLRQGVTFHDGEQWNCSVAKLNFDHVLSPPLTTGDWHGWYGLPEQVQSWSCLSDYEFVLTTKDRYYPLLQELSYIRPLRMLSPSKFVGGLSSDPLTQNSCHKGWGSATLGDVTVECAGTLGVAGTGRWKYTETVNDASGDLQEVVFERFAEHWGPASGDVEVLRLVRYEDHAAVKTALLRGEIDAVVGAGVLEPADIDEFTNWHADEYQVLMSEPLMNMIVVLNSGKAPTDKLSVRKVLIHAVNKGAIVTKELKSLSEPVNSLFPRDAPYCQLHLTPTWDYDLEKAELLNCNVCKPSFEPEPSVPAGY